MTYLYQRLILKSVLPLLPTHPQDLPVVDGDPQGGGDEHNLMKE